MFCWLCMCVCKTMFENSANSMMHSMFGISKLQVRALFERVAEKMNAVNERPRHEDLRAFYSSFAAVATGVTWDQLVEMQPCWLTRVEAPVSERVLRDDFKRVVLLLERFPLMNPELRFRYYHPAFPAVTAMLDATVVHVRSRRPCEVAAQVATKDANYSGKHKMICFKAEVWCTMNGIPIAFRGVTEGSVHDTRLFKSGRCADGTREHLLDHAKGEYWLADLGYQGCAHCLVPFKHAAGQEDLPAAEKKFNTHHARIRSRIERLFALLDVFRCFTYCEHEAEWLTGAFRIALNALHVILASKPQYSDCATFTAQEAKAALHHEECWCDKGCGVHPDTTAQRVTVMTAIQEQRLAYAPKKPAKRARSI